MLANGTGTAITKGRRRHMVLHHADYAFGQALERDTTAAVLKNGGKVIGGVKAPINNQDFSSFLLQAQSSKAKIIGLANAGGDTTNSIKQAAEFGIVKGGQKLAGLLVFLTDIHSLGLQTAQGLTFTETFYWDQNDASRAFSKRFAALDKGIHPTMVHAGVYSSVLHYLKAVEALKSDDGTKVVAKMKEMATDDPLFGKGTIRADGRKIHPAFLVQVKTPAESKYPWDYYKIVATIPADQAFRPMADGGCSLVKYLLVKRSAPLPVLSRSERARERLGH
jgi:branched-chain amino acid transport system substrate-binding protein